MTSVGVLERKEGGVGNDKDNVADNISGDDNESVYSVANSHLNTSMSKERISKGSDAGEKKVEKDENKNKFTCRSQDLIL